MIITREIDYSFRILRAISDGETHPVKPLCEAESIPWKFAYKILGKLRDAGVVQNTSGVHGGCKLIADLHDITALDVFTIIDGKPYINKCLEEGYICNWVVKKGTPCGVNRNLAYIQKQFEQLLDSYSIYSLINEDLFEKFDPDHAPEKPMEPDNSVAI